MAYVNPNISSSVCLSVSPSHLSYFASMHPQIASTSPFPSLPRSAPELPCNCLPLLRASLLSLVLFIHTFTHIVLFTHRIRNNYNRGHISHMRNRFISFPFADTHPTLYACVCRFLFHQSAETYCDSQHAAAPRLQCLKSNFIYRHRTFCPRTSMCPSSMHARIAHSTV